MSGPLDAPLVDVQALYDRVPDAANETVRALAAVADASALVRAEGCPDWTADTIAPAVATVVLNVAARVFRNPDGATSQTDTVGPFSRSRTWSAGSTGLDMGYLTSGERKLIQRLAGKSGLWVQRTRRDRCFDIEEQLVDVDGGVDPVLYYAEEDIADLHLDSPS